MLAQKFDKLKRPKVSIGVMILNEQDEVLVSQRIDSRPLFDGAWQFPGGHQEFGESWAQTSYREVLEECDLELDVKKIKVIEVMDV